MDPNNPFTTFKKYAFRLEALPQYIVEEEAQDFKEYVKSGRIPDDSQLEWLKLVKDNINAGKKMQRLRLLSDKLTIYEKFELQTYPGLQVGEDIRINSRHIYSEKYKYDFWFFDDQWIAQINYETDGTFVNLDVRKAEIADLEMYKYWADVFNKSKPLIIRHKI